MRFLRSSFRNLENFSGVTLPRFQVILFGIALVVSALFWLLQGDPSFPATLIFTLVVGNVTNILMALSSPLFGSLTPPRDWFVYIAVLLPVSGFGSLLATLAIILTFGHEGHLAPWIAGNVEIGMIFSLVTGISLYAVNSTRVRLEARNKELQNEVQLGAFKLQAQEADLRTAHDIQAGLLPSEIPQIKRFQIACAWQPAESVGGDYFDVVAFNESQIAICLADVSGKGISAALLMANLQAAFRAFASAFTRPAELCAKLNSALCSNIGPGKFVTFFYGVLDNQHLSFHYENAGHSQPILLRGADSTTLQGGGTVLGIFPTAIYQDRAIQLLPGDCLILTTDGVTEAASPSGEEFGHERVAESARKMRKKGAHAIRTQILEDVTAFCNGSFEDDASLIVATVEE